jgi:hypothetical protein
MSQANVEAFGRGIDAYNRGDIDALVAELDPEVEWYGVVLPRFIGEATVFRGHEEFVRCSATSTRCSSNFDLPSTKSRTSETSYSRPRTRERRLKLVRDRLGRRGHGRQSAAGASVL